MAVQPAFMLIADIAGYTRFMKSQRTSLAHAHDIIARLLEAVIDAAGNRLTLAKLEGDAAFFYAGYSGKAEPDLRFVSDQITRLYRAFHDRLGDIVAANHCKCDGCMQAGNLKIKFAGHFGEAAIHKVKRMTELAGVDVILVHRLLKNDVPVPEYLLMTEPVLNRLEPQLRERAEPHAMQVDEIGHVDAYFVDVARYVGEVPRKPVRGFLVRFAGALGLVVRTLPYVIGVKKPCRGCQHIPDAHSQGSFQS